MDAVNGKSLIAEKWKKHFTCSPRAWRIVFLGPFCAWLAYSRSYPFGPAQFMLKGGLPAVLLGACVIYPCFFLIGIDYLVRAVVCLVTRRFNARDARWYVVGLLIVGAIVMGTTDRLVCLRFSENRSALEATAATLLQETPARPTDEGCGAQRPYCAFEPYDKQLGDYHVIQAAVFRDERVVYLMTGGWFRSGWGFLYDPDGNVGDSEIRSSPIGDGWSLFSFAKE
jgi:hypothetical protein